MASNERKPAYPPIDVDPHFRRVVQNFRSSDYLMWGTATAAFPGALYMMEMIDPSRPPRGGLRAAMRLGTVLGAFGGFLMAYQRSSLRFWGWTENSIERARAEKEGNSAPGLDPSKSSLDPHLQSMAHRNSAFSQLKFAVIPWFNVVSHPFHGEEVKAAATTEDESE